ncbi:lysozyme inhibitor LprI family protein [Pseudomonas sp. R37(2017)]|uniref:lysozyme inhibitor LprI family protein n=1 Tax=Pseudomonas sp. R37(2017) TaxID=1981685 RepID=UPI000A1EF1E7|nr:lysozyme inhibitor LprI family protein [Pseudomonas sp. R37(2017)]
MKMVKPLLVSILAVSACVTADLCAAAKKPLPTYKTSFDCAGSRVSVEKLICHDAQLAQMDLELNRLYLLALTDDHSVPRPDKVEVDQRFWIDARNQCGSGPQARACVIRSYAERAHQLRQGSAIARTRDPSRRTEGPLAYRCAGFSPLISATFFTVEPGVVFLKWANGSVTLNQVPSSYGTQYTGKDYKGSYSFRQIGNDVFLQIPGSGQMSCAAEPDG